jgi:uncharacterized protein YbjT (DUF2867 family)
MPGPTDGEVLLTGAAGFVGSRLWPALNAEGLRVRCVTRDAERAAHRWPERDWVQADLADPAGRVRALAGCRVAYYLVHGLAERQQDFRSHEVALARAFSDAAARQGIERIVYLGGVAPQGPPSEHLRSRLEVGEALRAGPVPVVELRAGMIVGAGSTSWLIVRDLAARLPAMVLPRWMQTRSQPVAVDDVVVALVRAGRVPLEASAWYDLPGPEILTGREILESAAEALGLRRPLILAVPCLSPALSSHWVRLVTRANWSVARELVLGLAHDLLARDDFYWRLIDHEPRLTFREAARRALAEEQAGGRMGGFARALEAAVGRIAGADYGAPVPRPGTTGLRSIQDIALPMDATTLEHWGEPGMLRHLIDAYFRVAEVSSGGLMRVRWAGDAPTIALRWLPLPLIIMGPPTIACESVRRAIHVPVIGGLVAEHRGSARLSIVLARHGTNVRLSVELIGYQPRGAHIWPVPWISWLQTQLHAYVGRRFVRRVARAWRRAS